jgi:hypothetical protein
MSDANFGLQRRPRPEQPGYRTPDELGELAHRADYQPIRSMTSAVEFPEGTLKPAAAHSAAKDNTIRLFDRLVNVDAKTSLGCHG